MRASRVAELLALLTLVGSAWIGFASSGLPRIVPSTAVDSAFSAERAGADLDNITARPHPTGTPEHDRIRDYLVDRLRVLGVSDVHVQSATGFNTLDGPIAATVANVTGRIAGLHGGPAILLTAHYDAVPRGLGAGDDAVAVAAILETVRALQHSRPLDRDLIILFSDAEEDGLLGAEAFVDLHPWARNVGLVLNFDGRGDQGPVYMFQTSPGNAALITALSRSVPDARANSLTGEVYRHLPSDTDMSIWLHSAFVVGALNFAHIGGYARYHTPVDDAASLDHRIVQQMGDYALGLSRDLGHTDLHALRSADDVYFNAPLLGVIRYPAMLALPIAMAQLLLVLLLTWRMRGVLTLSGLARAGGWMKLSIATVTLGAYLGWRAVFALHPAFREILQREPYQAPRYLVAVLALSIAATLGWQSRARRHCSIDEISTSALLLWAVIGVASALLLPGSSYLIAWPLTAVIVAQRVAIRRMRGTEPLHPAFALAAFPALVLWLPLITALETGLTANALWVCALLLALVLAIIAIPIAAVGSLRKPLAVVAVLVGVIALVIAETGSAYNPKRPRPDSLLYVADADSGRAWWGTFDHANDEWTTQVLGAAPIPHPFPENRFGRRMLVREAVVADTTSPVQVVSNTILDGHHWSRIHVARTGDGEMVAIYAARGSVSGLVVNGRALTSGTSDRYSATFQMDSLGTVLRYFGVPEGGIDLRLAFRDTLPATLRIVTGIQGFPSDVGITVPPRPAGFMSKPFVLTDMTVVARDIRLP